jgi:hypothetical protein
MKFANNFDISFGDRAVWVNSAGGCLGRFGKNGIDVHRAIDEEGLPQPQCLFCTHAPVNLDDWTRFVDAMKQFHGVDISSYAPPTWLTTRVAPSPRRRPS